MTDTQDDTVMKEDGDDVSFVYSSVDADECVSGTNSPTDLEHQDCRRSGSSDDGEQKGKTEMTVSTWLSWRFAKWGVLGMTIVCLALLVALKNVGDDGTNNLDASITAQPPRVPQDDANETVVSPTRNPSTLTTATPDIPATSAPSDQPSSSPTSTLPSDVPTTDPTLAPNEPLPANASTFAPTFPQPTEHPTLIPTTTYPTYSPTKTLAPTSSQLQQLQTTLSSISKNPAALSDRASPEFLAMKWLLNMTTTDSDAAVSFDNLVSNRNRLQQRFAVTVLDLAIQGRGERTPKFARYDNNPLDECSWVGINCTNRTVDKIVWAGDRSLQGQLPEDLGLLTSIDHLDLAENNITGTLPAGLYNNLIRLQYLYLHDNRLTGTISQDISKLNQLEKLFLGDNRLTGSLPRELRNAQQLRFLHLGRNKLSGPIPNDLNLEKLYYLDMSHNSFSGEIPTDWYLGRDTFYWLRHLYLNNNNLSGEIPEEFTSIGAGRLAQLDVSNNNFSGIFPGSWDPLNMMEALEIHGNNFTSVHREVCWLSVFNLGEMTAYRSDCAHCICGWPFCRPPRCY